MIKKIVKEVFDFACISAMAWWFGVMLMLGAISASDIAGVSVAIGYEEQKHEQ